MKRRMCWSVLAVCALLLVGCEPQVSVFPLFTSQDAVFDPQLLGEWQIWSGKELKPGDKPAVIVFSASQEARTYDVKIPNFDEQKDALITAARLVKLGDSVFIDFGTPNMDHLPLIPYPAMEGHVFGRLSLAGDKAEIDLLSDDWVNEEVKAGKMPLGFYDASKIVLSANSEELRKFAADHAEDSKAFSEVYSLVRKSASH
jgi:hypothetical protein